MMRLNILLWGWVCVGLTAWSQLPDVPVEAIAELGITSGTPQLTGFVFLEGRYVPPPYTMTRKGNGLFLNRVQFEQPVAWSVFDSTQAVSSASGGTTAPASEPAAPSEPAAKVLKSLDDLFEGAQNNDAPAPAVAAEPATREPAAASGETAGVEAVSARRTPAEIQKAKVALRDKLDAKRKAYEDALSKGDVFFFSQRNNLVNGTYGTARALFDVLPQALRQAQSAQDLQTRLQQGGIYFLDAGLCEALFRNKTTFPMLEARLREIVKAEEVEALRRSQETMW